MPGYAERSQRQEITSDAPQKKATLNWSPNPPPAYEVTESDQQRGPARREWDNVSARIAARTARHSTRRASRGETSTRIQKSSARKHKPGLSIDTTVTRHIGAPPQQLQTKGARKRSSGGYRKLGEGTQPRVERITNNAKIEPVISTQPAQPPNKRPLDPSTFGATIVSHFSPETPTIVITPAFEGAALQPSGRAASSLYSQATFAPSFVDHGTPPPLPTNTPYFQSQAHATGLVKTKNLPRDSSATDFEVEVEVDEKKMKNGRVTSTATLFEEDNTSLTAPARGGRNGGDLYIDTTIPPTPRRSLGWWNVITTPFESAKSVSRFFRSPTDGSRTPDIPPLPNTLIPGRPTEKFDTLSPESATRPNISHSQSQKQSQKQKISINFLSRKETQATGGAQDTRSPEILDHRATHNSQALRRLESHEKLPSEPVPPLPVQHIKAARESEYNTFSPNEREVPIVLSFNPTVIVEHPQNPFSSQAQGPAQSAGLGMTMKSQKPEASVGSPNPEPSPRSGVTEFSPVGQLTGAGTVLYSKAIINDEARPGAQPTGMHAHSFASTSRSSMAAEIVKPAYGGSPARPHRPEDWQAPNHDPLQASRQTPDFQPRQEMTFLPPPHFASQPAARFSAYTSKTEKPKRKKLFFTICARDKKDKDPKKKKNKKRWCCCCFCFLLLLLVGIAIALAVILSRRHKPSPITNTDGQPTGDKPTFVTISNFPPVPTGVLTIARPNLRTSVSGCVNPKALWSCAVPKEQQDSIKPNDPDQPNFVVTINVDNAAAQSASRMRRDATSGSLTASSWVKKVILQGRDSTTFTPSPAPPTLEEQAFVGKTTDENTAPFEGETTPFFISFKPPVQVKPTKAKRQDASSSSDSSATSTDISNIATSIPIPNVNPDGTAEPANLLPYPVNQPLRLYNRGAPDEHLGFYTYFERNIFLKSIQIQNTTQQLMGDIPSDLNGGSAFAGATARCSWRDTRFLVKIWTNKGDRAQLLPSTGSSAGKSGSSSQTFTRPGTFPYPVTISLDRHGGGLTTKMLFCYGMDARGHLDINSRKFQPEFRDFAGQLQNPAQGPFESVNVSLAEGGPGGIDGGSGGCECEWANWLSK
ncbi:hypothetical protein EJ08DRAFT_147609 [Tothia fuscella]|uniref:Glycoprotease family protein n=1 Tax=Tothia fuscella TaxID=1048955 RepID=A0A9P4U347_9PEZI|nr:hypothetical protein EJ08DRAFT_147609 [Tothia fuscella]